MADYQAMSLPSWITSHKRWEKPTLGNIQLPGIVHFKGVNIKLRIERNKSSGNDGGGSLIKGLEMPKFMFEIMLITAEDEDIWNRIAPILLPRKDPSNRGFLPVYHPSLARFQIVACIVEEIEEIPPGPGGMLMIRIHCLAVSPVKQKATKNIKPKGVGGDGPAAISIGGTGNAGPQRFPGVTPPSQKAPVR